MARIPIQAEVVGHEAVVGRCLMQRLLLFFAGGSLVERQPATFGQPLGSRQRIGALALKGAFRRQLKQVVKALPLGL